jgi:RNA-binding protein 39
MSHLQEFHQSIIEPVFAAYQEALQQLHNPPAPPEPLLSSASASHSHTPHSHAHVNLSEAQRDRRTVFVQQLAVRCTDTDLTDFFNSHNCPVRQSKLVIDKYTRRSKGVAYVEFFEEESVKAALKLTGIKIFGVPVVVELTETEKNRLAEEAAAAAALTSVQAKASAASEEAFTARLYVGSLHPSLSEEDLKGVFEPFGQLVSVELLRDVQSGVSKGVAYIQFGRGDSAKRALEALNGFELAGKKIRIGSMKK